MPLQSRWPLFEASASTCLPSASRASAKYSPSSIQKSRLKRRFRSAACFSSSSAKRRIVPDQPGEAGTPHLRVVRVALELAGRPREPGKPAVAVGDRVPGVLPALVLEPGLLVAALVRDVAVAHEVGVLVDPAKRGPRFVLELAHELAVAGPALVLVEQDHVERRCVGAAVVGRMRPLLEGSHLAVAHLVQDAARILVAEVVDPAFPATSPSTRSVVAASSGVNGSACRLVKMLSRPNIVMNHGRPAAGRLRPAGDDRREAQRGEVDEAAAVRRRAAAPSRIRSAARPRSIVRGRSMLLRAAWLRARPRLGPRLAPSSVDGVTTSQLGRPLAVWLDPDRRRSGRSRRASPEPSPRSPSRA